MRQENRGGRGLTCKANGSQNPGRPASSVRSGENLGDRDHLTGVRGESTLRFGKRCRSIDGAPLVVVWPPRELGAPDLTEAERARLISSHRG